MKRIALFLAVLTVAAACSSTDDTATAPDAVSDSAPTTAGATEDTNATTDSIGDSGASLVPNATIAPEGPAAPNFTMALADGGTFTLSEEAKPVYMIFWADW